jgi:LytS/YehU family sensor histidine kinase
MSTLVVIIGITVAFYTLDNRRRDPELRPRVSMERPFEKPPRGIPREDAPPHSPPPPPMKSQGFAPKPIPKYANFLILAVLLVGFDTGLKISMRWANLEQEKFKLQKENVENQMAFLKNQVSPHFFMNTLNNIHALIDIDAEEAKDSIIKLSKLMRHLLYDSEEKLTPIKKEVEFIQSYIELMRLRFTDKVNIEVDIPEDIPDKSIPPLLFTSLLENAFKHGISYNQISFVKIVMSFSENRLNFIIENSNHPRDREASSGIGIENTKKRLSLLYKDNFDLEILEDKEIYKVNLSIPL